MHSSESHISLTVTQALDKLEALYDDAVSALRDAIGDFITHGTLPDTNARAAGLFPTRLARELER